MRKVFANEIIKEFELNVVNRESANMIRQISQPSITRIGLELAGVYVKETKDDASHSDNNIIGWGTKERKWLSSLTKEKAFLSLHNALNAKTPLLILSPGVYGEPLEWILEVANSYRIPVVRWDTHLSDAVATIAPYLSIALSQTEDVHGSLVSIYGHGVMVVGPSGIGKSEAVLELIQDNHLFISDDTVVISRVGNQFLGRSAEITRGYLEARGIGLIDIQHMFGAQIVLDQTNIDLVVELVNGKHMEDLDRLGDRHLFYKVLNGKIPLIQIPVNEGRSISALIKAATSTFIAKKHGMDPLASISDRTRKG